MKKSVYVEKELKHYLGALAENYNENLKAIRENSVLINEKLDKHTKILDEHTKILDQHTEMIGTLMEDVSSIKSDLKKKVDYDEFVSLVKRVQKLETKHFA